MKKIFLVKAVFLYFAILSTQSAFSINSSTPINNLCYALSNKLYDRMRTSDKSNISYSIATKKDVEQIVRMYNNMADADKKKLVIYPGEFLRKKLLKSIKKGHFFVARSHRKIVSFLKVFVATQNEFNELNIDGLPAIKPETYRYQEGMKCERVRNFPDIFDKIERAFREDDCFFIYFGNAYTEPKLRGKGICSELLKYGLETVIYKYEEFIKEKRFLALMYGLVLANKDHKYMIDSFAKVSKTIFEIESPIILYRAMYEAYKPSFKIDDHGNLLPFFPIEGKGYGNMTLINFPAPATKTYFNRFEILSPRGLSEAEAS